MYKEIICNFKNIYKAYRLAHRGKSDDPSVIEFDKNKIYNLHKIRKYLENKEWDEILKYYTFKIYEPKERIIDAMQFEGRIVQHIICDNILNPYFEKRLIKENCACRKNKGTLYASNILKQNLIKFNKKYNSGYVLKLDIHKYFPSINHKILKDMISDFPDSEVREFLFYIIDKSPSDVGIPIGNQTSQWFALYYIDSLDRIIKEKYSCKFYVRYMDDLIIIHNSKEYLQKLFKDLNEKCLNLDLNFNYKSQIINLNKGFTFIGWRYTIKNNKIIIRIPNEKRKFRIKTINNFYKIENVKQKEAYRLSIVNNLEYGDTYKFQYNKKLRKKTI